MTNNHDKFIQKVLRSIERLAKQNHIKMWAQEHSKHIEPVEHGKTEITHFIIYSGDLPTDKDLAATEYEIPDTLQ